MRVLTTDELYLIHQSTLELLSQVGVKILEEESLQVLAESGAEVDYDYRIAKIPERLVDEAIKKAPRSFVLYGRSAKYSTRFEDKNNRVYFHMSGTPGKLLDLETGRSRPATVRDLDGFFRLADALENIDHPGVAVLPTDVPGSVVHAYMTLSGFMNTTKPLDGWNEGKLQSHDTIRMAMEVAGGEEELKRKPRLLAYTQPVSPLQYTVGTTQGLRIYAEHNQPQIIVPWPQGGATAPVTLAGTLVQQNAEILGAVVMAQLFSPGAPVIYGSSATIMDQSTGCTSVGGVEVGLMNAAAAQLARYYRLPSRATAGDTDSKIPDAQAGFEKAITLLMAALSGVNLVDHAAGTLESASTACYEQAVIDNEVCGMVRRVLRGFTIDEETLAVEVIERAGPGGSFLSEPHTLRHYKNEVYLPKLADRESRAMWEKAGSKDLRETAREEAKKILDQYCPEPLDHDIEVRLREIVKEIEVREKARNTSK